MCKACKKSFKTKINVRKHEGRHRNEEQALRIASLNIGGGLYRKEEMIQAAIEHNNFAIIGLHETEVSEFDKQRPFSLKGYKTYFPKKGKNMTRQLVLVKEDIEERVVMRSDLMSEEICTV